jgi:hypothetical protein
MAKFLGERAHHPLEAPRGQVRPQHEDEAPAFARACRGKVADLDDL